MKISENFKFSNEDTKNVFSIFEDDYHIISKLNQLKPAHLPKIWKQFYQSNAFKFVNADNVDWDEVLTRLKNTNV